MAALSALPELPRARLRPEALAVRIEGCDIAALVGADDPRARGPSSVGWKHCTAGQSWPAYLDQVEKRLDYLGQIGLDYLSLDRPGADLSGGELQRVIMTKTLGSGLVNTLYVLDEPTVGLHPHDVGRLIAVLHRLRDRGNTLVVVEHDTT